MPGHMHKRPINLLWALVALGAGARRWEMCPLGNCFFKKQFSFALNALGEGSRASHVAGKGLG